MFGTFFGKAASAIFDKTASAVRFHFVSQAALEARIEARLGLENGLTAIRQMRACAKACSSTMSAHISPSIRRPTK